VNQLFTVLLIFSHFIVGLPKPSDIESMSKAELVKKYSSACRAFLQIPDVKSEPGSAGVSSVFDLSQLMQQTTSEMSWLEGKGDSREVLQFVQKICKTDPDLTALDSYDEPLKKAVAEYRNTADQVMQLPNVDDVRKVFLPQAIELISSDNKIIADISNKNGRRKFVGLDQLPAYVPSTLVAVEDGRFFNHKGIDEIGILRALMKDMKKSGARQGGSTITQQVARNLYLNLDQNMHRKMQEILIAEKIEKQLSKNQILEIYLNLIYFGRNSWGIEKAAQSYFHKNAKKLTLVETAFLIGIIHGPNVYRSHPSRIEGRLRFVLEKMKDQSILAASDDIDVLMHELKILPDVDTYNSGYARDYTIGQVKKTNPGLLVGGTQIKTTIDSRMQIATSEALQEGLANYEANITHRPWDRPLSNIQAAIGLNAIKVEEAEKLRKVEEENSAGSLFSALTKNTAKKNSPSSATKDKNPVLVEKSWVSPLTDILPKYPIPIARWRLAVLLSDGRKIGLNDGRESALSEKSLAWAHDLKYGDIFYVRPVGQNIWEAVQPPLVNGSAVIMDTKGRVLAMVGGFSYSLSGYNRATQALRQPGSLIKPFTYLAALQKGIQPNTILSSAPLTFPPVARGGHSWTPSNHGNQATGPMPMRWALENSINILTARLMSLFGIDPVRELTQNFGLYENPIYDYPFILGAQTTNLVTLVKAYAEIANQGFVVSPRVVDQGPINLTQKIAGVDDISLFQLRYLMQGAIERGTAARLSKYSKVLAGKTGTTNDSKDLWFIGFTSKIVIGVYVGYDEPESLGGETTGAAVAMPIFEKIFGESIKILELPEPFPAAPKGVVFYPTNKKTGEIVKEMSKDTVLEAYREGAIKKEQIK
jgi:penicillin-binding protein 1A